MIVYTVMDHHEKKVIVEGEMFYMGTTAFVMFRAPGSDKLSVSEAPTTWYPTEVQAILGYKEAMKHVYKSKMQQADALMRKYSDNQREPQQGNSEQS